MSVTIGDLKVIHTETLIIPYDKTSWISFSKNGINIKMKIDLDNDKTTSESKFQVYGEEDYGVLKLTNWKSTVLEDPIKIVENRSKNFDVYFMIFGNKISNTLKLDLQFYVKEAK